MGMRADHLARVLSASAVPVAATIVAVLGGCRDAPPRADFANDSRYARQVVFQVFDVTIPLAEGHYVRSDGAVDDVVKHTDELLEEIGRGGANVTLTNPARYGRQMCLTFENGDVCSFLWVQRDPDAQAVQGRLNHERYHALHALQPESIALLDRKAEELGYRLDLRSLDEELAATTVEVLTLYALGNPIVIGTGHVMESVEVLEAARKAGKGK